MDLVGWNRFHHYTDGERKQEKRNEERVKKIGDMVGMVSHSI